MRVTPLMGGGNTLQVRGRDRVALEGMRAPTKGPRGVADTQLSAEAQQNRNKGRVDTTGSGGEWGGSGGERGRGMG